MLSQMICSFLCAHHNKDLSEACTAANDSLEACSAADGSLNKSTSICTNSALKALRDACACFEADSGGDDAGEECLNDIVQKSLVMAPKFAKISHNQMVQKSKRQINQCCYMKSKVKKSIPKQDAQTSSGQNTSAQTSKGKTTSAQTSKGKQTSAQTSKGKKKKTSAQTSKGEKTSAETNKVQKVCTDVTCTPAGNKMQPKQHHTESPDYVPECTQKMQIVRYKGYSFPITEQENREMKNSASRAYHTALKAEMTSSCDKTKAVTAAQIAHRKIVDDLKDKYLKRHKTLEALDVDGDNAADVS